MAGNPVILLTVGRSGSSMVAGILANHGIWTGDVRPGNPNNQKGYFENPTIKRELYRHHGRDWLGPVPDGHPEFFAAVERIKRKQGYIDGLWMNKTGAFYHNAWRQFDPLFVKIMRPLEDVIASHKRVGWLYSIYSDDEVEELIVRHMRIMQGVRGVTIHSDAIAGGSFSAIKALVERLGLEWDQEMVESFVDGDLYAKRL